MHRRRTGECGLAAHQRQLVAHQPVVVLVIAGHQHHRARSLQRCLAARPGDARRAGADDVARQHRHVDLHRRRYGEVGKLQVQVREYEQFHVNLVRNICCDQSLFYRSLNAPPEMPEGSADPPVLRQVADESPVARRYARRSPTAKDKPCH